MWKWEEKNSFTFVCKTTKEQLGDNTLVPIISQIQIIPIIFIPQTQKCVISKNELKGNLIISGGKNLNKLIEWLYPDINFFVTTEVNDNISIHIITTIHAARDLERLYDWLLQIGVPENVISKIQQLAKANNKIDRMEEEFYSKLEYISKFEEPLDQITACEVENIFRKTFLWISQQEINPGSINKILETNVLAAKQATMFLELLEFAEKYKMFNLRSEAFNRVYKIYHRLYNSNYNPVIEPLVRFLVNRNITIEKNNQIYGKLKLKNQQLEEILEGVQQENQRLNDLVEELRKHRYIEKRYTHLCEIEEENRELQQNLKASQEENEELRELKKKWVDNLKDWMIFFSNKKKSLQEKSKLLEQESQHLTNEKALLEQKLQQLITEIELLKQELQQAIKEIELLKQKLQQRITEIELLKQKLQQLSIGQQQFKDQQKEFQLSKMQFAREKELLKQELQRLQRGQQQLTDEQKEFQLSKMQFEQERGQLDKSLQELKQHEYSLQQNIPCYIAKNVVKHIARKSQDYEKKMQDNEKKLQEQKKIIKELQEKNRLLLLYLQSARPDIVRLPDLSSFVPQVVIGGSVNYFVTPSPSTIKNNFSSSCSDTSSIGYKEKPDTEAADVAKKADAPFSGSGGEIHAGSNPAIGTNKFSPKP